MTEENLAIQTAPLSNSLQKMQVRKLNSRHYQLMMYMLLGMSETEAAKKIRMTQARVSIVVNSPLFVKEKNRFQEKITDKFIQTQATLFQRTSDEAIPAFEKMVELENCGQRKVEFVAAKDILDRWDNLSNTQKVDVANVLFSDDSFKDTVSRIVVERITMETKTNAKPTTGVEPIVEPIDIDKPEFSAIFQGI